MKTHSGVRSEFARLTKDLSGPDRDLAGTLARGYEHEELADYGTDPERVVEAAADAIAAAEHFVDRVATLLSAAGV